MMKQPLVYIIIVNYNGYEDTIDCMNSLEKITYTNYKIVIVDNCSSDGSQDILRERFPDCYMIMSDKNLGFAGGNNLGIIYAMDNGADYVLLLNNDTIVEKDFLEPLVNVAESDMQIAVVGGKIYYYNNPNMIWFAGGEINTFTGKTKHISVNKIDDCNINKVSEVDYITGCLMLVDCNAIKKVGIMDDSYFLYYEEVDWNVRFKKNGYKIVYVPESRIYHKVSASTNKINYAVSYYYGRNVNYFINKNFNLFRRTFMYFYIRFILVLKTIKAIIKRDKKKLSVIKRTYIDIKNRKMGEFTI